MNTSKFSQIILVSAKQESKLFWTIYKYEFALTSLKHNL